MESDFLLDIPEILLTEACFYVDFNSNDFETEIRFMQARNAEISDFYKRLMEGTLTKGDVEQFGDFLNDYWIDPNAWYDSILQSLA